MTTAPTSRTLIALFAVVALLGSACGDDEPRVYGFAGSEVLGLEDNPFPAQILDLTVEEEDVTETLQQVQNTYVDVLSIYSFRFGEQLQATLQVGHFGPQYQGQVLDPEAPYYQDEKFRLGLVNNIGGSAPREVRLQGEPIWLTTGTNQQLAIWFRGEYFLVLATRNDYTQPRSLLRELVGVEL